MQSCVLTHQGHRSRRTLWLGALCVIWRAFLRVILRVILRYQPGSTKQARNDRVLGIDTQGRRP
jgi:hypothetical protein